MYVWLKKNININNDINHEYYVIYYSINKKQLVLDQFLSL